MEAIDELETKRDEQSDEQQNIGQDRGRVHSGFVDIGIDAVRRVQHPDPEQPKEQNNGPETCWSVEPRSSSRCVAPPGVPGKRADLLYVVIFCRLVLRDDYLVLRLA